MYLGIDLGTSEIKAVLTESDGAVVGTAGAPLTVSRPHHHWAEQTPDGWWQGAQAAIDLLKKGYPTQLSAVRAIGLSGQMHGATLLDRADRPLRPAILWNDTRAGAQCLELAARAPELESITGNLAMPGLTAPKMLWVAEYEPEIFRETASVLLPKDYIRLRLTGDKVSDMSDASGTLWLDVGKRDWSDTMLAASGLARSHMPRLVEGSHPSGTLRRELADAWGMKTGVIVAGGGGDNAASAVGMGVTEPGDGLLSLGTSGVIFVVTDRFKPHARAAVHTFCHALPERWHQMSVMLSAADCLRWAVRLTGAPDEADLLARAFATPLRARSRAPIFLPYLSGERTPHNDANAQGVLFGLTHDTDTAAIGYAVVEGVAFGLADGFAALQSADARVIPFLSLVGGGARSPAWAQLIADVLDVPLRTYSGAELGAAIGAARLARLADGASEAEVCQKPRPAAAFNPTHSDKPMLDDRQQHFRALYTATKDLFPRQ
jgi:xylulokinase